MIRQMIQLIWKRKRSNIFLVAELLLTFFVLYTVCAVGLHTWNRYTGPDGFSVENVLNINIENVGARGESRVNAPIVFQAVRILHDMQETEAIGIGAWGLFQRSMSSSSITVNDKDYQPNYVVLDDGCLEALSMDVIHGRWFGPEDDGSIYIPVVINRRFAREAYGDADPLGEILQDSMVIVGVISDFRLYGPFDKPRNLIIQQKLPIDLGADDSHINPQWSGDIYLKLNTPITPELNARIFDALQNIAPGWTLNIDSAEDLRDACIKQQATPYLTAGVASASLIAMVILGLFGVLWQNIIARTREIGLRRAKGANIGDIYAQIIGEMLLITTAAVVPGMLIIAQLLMMDVMGNIPIGTHVIALCCAAAFLYLMVVACSLYPGYMATRINPAQALHYE